MTNMIVKSELSEEKTAALILFMKKKELVLEDELAKVITGLYDRYVPQPVREYIAVQEGLPKTKPAKRVLHDAEC